MATTLTPHAAPLARQAREHFVAHMQGLLPHLAESLRSALSAQMNGAKSGREMQLRRDDLIEFQHEGPRWIEATGRAWQRAVIPPTATGRVRMDLAAMTLIGDEVVENKIL